MPETCRGSRHNEVIVKVKVYQVGYFIVIHRSCWFGHVQRMEENRIPKRLLYMNLVSTRPRGRPRNYGKMK
jgi:hypothetical protein